MSNRYFLSLILFFSLSLSPVISFPEEINDLETLLLNIKAKEKTLKTIKFDFEQVIDIAPTKETQSVVGKASFMEPDKFRFEFTAPVKQTIVTDGKYLFVYNEDNNQVLKDALSSWAKNMDFPEQLINFHSRIDDLKDRYHIEYKERNGNGEYIINLKPKDPSGLEYDIDIWIDQENFIPVRSNLRSANFSTRTKISNIRLNTKMTSKTFKFTVPKGADLIEGPGITER